jgi:hypothetical protein
MKTAKKILGSFPGPGNKNITTKLITEAIKTEKHLQKLLKHQAGGLG